MKMHVLFQYQKKDHCRWFGTNLGYITSTRLARVYDKEKTLFF